MRSTVLKNRSLFWAEIMFVIVIALNGTAVALAQSQDEQQACTNDAMQLCQDAIPDRERVFRCLVSNKDLLSVPCHAVMAPHLPVDPPLKTKASPAKSAKTKGTSTKPASKAGSRQPLNILPR